MAISGFSPLNALPGMMPSPLGVASQPTGGALHAGIGAVDARAALTERPGIASRLMSAMRAAIAELRGERPAPLPVTQSLPQQVQRPVTLAKRPAQPARRARKVKSAKSAKTWKTLANPRRSTLPMQPRVQPQPQAQLPLSNMTMLPGATVYSYDQYGNPVTGGLTPTMLQGLQGLTGRIDPDGPQLNATNQTNLSGLLNGIGLGAGTGTAEPVLGAPIAPQLIAQPDAAAPTATTPAAQSVTNRNVTDVASRQQGYGYGYGTPWDPTGGVATPWTPYGASMQGGANGGISGWFSRFLRG